MEKLSANICRVCGGTLKNYGTHYKCICCDTEYRIEGSMSKKEADDHFRRQNAFEDAERNLSVSPPRFDEAESDFQLIVQKYPDWSAGYWGLVRAKFGIKFEQDVDGKAIPSCYKSTYEDLRETDEYKRAIELAETPELRKSYERWAGYIAHVATEWREEAQKYDYDVFISFKASDDANGSETRDAREMQNLYTYLTQQGYKVFFSPVTLRTEGYSGRRSEPYIFNALDKSEALIVYGSKKEYFTSPWVQNEWQRYLRAMEKSRRPKDSLLVLYDGFNPKELPQGLRGIQAIDHASKTAYNEILNVLQNIFDGINEGRVAPMLERIDIAAGSVGKRATSVGERIGTIQLGASVVPKNAKRAVLPVQMRELGTASHAVNKERSKFAAALTCLRNGYFDDAQRMFDACLRENDKNGDLWLGKLCSDLNDSALYDEIKGDSPETAHSVEIVRDHVTLQNAIDFAADKPTAERLLSYVYEQIVTRFGATGISPAEAETVFKLYKLCGDYDSENSRKMCNFLSRKADMLAQADAYQLLVYLCARIPDVDELISTLKSAAEVYLKNGHFDKATYFNDRIHELDAADPSALMNAFYIANNVVGEDDLLTSAAEKKTSFSVLEKGLPKIEKTNAEKILSVLCEAEIAFLNRGNFVAAEKYFDFIVRYDFTGRDDLMRKNIKYSGPLAEHRCISFYEKLLSVYPDRSTIYHINSRIIFADKLLICGYFSDATAMYNSVLDLDSENAAALSGLIYCILQVNGKKSSKPHWQDWDQKLFERALAACPDKKTQSDFVDMLCKLCISSVNGKTINIKRLRQAKAMAVPKSHGSSPAKKTSDSYHGQKKADFQIQDGALIKYKGPQSKVIIPDNVTSIGYQAFSNCTYLTSVMIGNNVENVGGSAFEHCNSLMDVQIGDGAKSIGPLAFDGCVRLTNVAIGNSVMSIGMSAFRNCIGLTSVAIPDSVASISQCAFKGCTGLTSVTFKNPNGWWYVPSTSATKSINIPRDDLSDPSKAANLLASSCADYKWERAHSGKETVFAPQKLSLSKQRGTNKAKSATVSTKTSETTEKSASHKTSATKKQDPYHGQNEADFQIENGVLIKYTGSQSHVIIPDNVTIIGGSVFENHSSLKNVKIGKNVTIIGPSAFSGCTGLTYITIPDSVTCIERYSFSGCVKLTSVMIGNGVNCIGWRAFKDCVGLTRITIPDSVTDIVNDAFHGCSNLTHVSFANPNGWLCASSVSSTRSINISRYDLRDSSKAAELLTSSHVNYHWERTHCKDNAMYDALDYINESDNYDYLDDPFYEDLDDHLDDDFDEEDVPFGWKGQKYSVNSEGEPLKRNGFRIADSLDDIDDEFGRDSEDELEDLEEYDDEDDDLDI